MFSLALCVLGGCHAKPRVLAPDYELDFECKNVPPAKSVETFMITHGFSSFDEEGARRRRGLSFFPIEIHGFDAHRVMLDVIGLREPISRGGAIHYRLTITGPPPTRRDPRLESDSARFVTDLIHCRIQGTHRNFNDAQSAALFGDLFDDEQRRLRAGR